MVDYGAILDFLFPGRQFSIGEDYQSIRSRDGGPIPTKQELDHAWPHVSAVIHNERARTARHADFISEADPLFMKWKAGEASQAEWLNKREEIRQRHPYFNVGLGWTVVDGVIVPPPAPEPDPDAPVIDEGVL